MQRPRVVRSQQNQFDIEFRKVLLTLPGVDRITITMGRTFTVEWDGIRAPV